MPEESLTRSPDQWKAEGRCNYCRRKSYCGCVCKARRRFVAAELQREFQKWLAQSLAEKKAEEAENQ